MSPRCRRRGRAALGLFLGEAALTEVGIDVDDGDGDEGDGFDPHAAHVYPDHATVPALLRRHHRREEEAVVQLKGECGFQKDHQFSMVLSFQLWCVFHC